MKALTFPFIRTLALGVVMAISLPGPRLTGAETELAPAPATTPDQDVKAAGLVREMCQTISSAPTLRVRGSSEIDAALTSTKKRERTKFDIEVLRPGMIKALISGDKDHDFINDGTMLSWLDHKENVYIQLPAQTTIDATVDLLAAKTSLRFPLGDFLANDCYNRNVSKWGHASYVAREKLGWMFGRECDHVALHSGHAVMDFWLDLLTHLPFRLSVTASDHEGQPKTQFDFKDWDLSVKLSAGDFEFKPGRKAKLMEPPGA